MSVEKILAEKGRNVITVQPGVSLGEAAKILHGHRIGAVVVVDESGGVLGIMSERDIVSAVAEQGAIALNAQVSSRMTKRVETCAPSATLDELMELMTARKFRHVPVVQGDRLDGIVSIGDIVKHRLADVEAEHRAMRDYIATA